MTDLEIPTGSYVFMKDKARSLEAQRTIWMYWNRGLKQAPDLVHICVESWHKRNPEWNFCVLDDTTLHDWLDMTDVRARNPRLTIQAYSDILRWRLLAQYGGVWADATLYCAKPLDSWLASNVTPDGFFVFRSPEAHLYHSWFLVGHPGNPVVKIMKAELDRFFIFYDGYRHYWDIRGVWRFYRLIERFAGRYNHQIWRSHFFRKYLKATPYFFQNYLTGAAISRSREAFDDFLSLTMKFGEEPHALQNMTQTNVCPSLETVRELLDGPCPMQKLTTKRFVAEWNDGGVLKLLDDYNRG